jgi:formylglycine-generating enzyme required for sulfatase activity
MVRVPAGQFVMGDTEGEPDEWCQAIVSIAEPFWMGETEITNEQFRRFTASHDSGYYARRLPAPDCQGTPLNGDQQPAVRISWEQAMAFCRWASDETGLTFSLPTEAQWEYACRAGCAHAMTFGDVAADFSSWANLADDTFSRGVMSPLDVHPQTVSQWSGGVPHLVLEGAALAERSFRDGYSVTAPVGQFLPNMWGLHDMHGNVAEWTQSRYADYPYSAIDGRNEPSGAGRRVVRGGSFFDPPHRARCSHRQSYHPWQRVFNVGFRVVCSDPNLPTQSASPAQ